MKKIFNNKYVLPVLIGLAGFLIGWWLKPSATTDAKEHDHESIYSNTAIGDAETVWTCSMHPQIRMSEPGKCPICGMDLIPLTDGGGTENPMAVEMTLDAMQLANIQTTVVGEENQTNAKEIRLNGRVTADERSVYVQASHLPGRIEQLNVNFTGEPVSKGKVLAMVYSPELVTAQKELLEAQKTKNMRPELFEAAKNKLKNWKLSEANIQRILEKGQTVDQFPILADVSGIVVEKKVNLGDYVQRGSPIYEIADLSSVWVQFEVYEADLPWIKVGSTLTYTLTSLPGEQHKGVVTFIDPVINPQTRVALARVEVKNKDGKLKPDMFAIGHVQAQIQADDKTALIIPKSAVMWTGERSVVYVKTQSDKNVYFALREVSLGTSLGDAYAVKSGLEAGEEIVTYGAFTVDAAAQLTGKPSMMRPEGGTAMKGHNHGGMEMENTKSQDNAGVQTLSKEAKDALEKIISDYIAIKNALVNDDLTQARQQATQMKKSVSNTSMRLFTGDAYHKWMDYEKSMSAQLEQMLNTEKIETSRKFFIDLSETIIALATDFGPFEKALFVQRCPMANQNQGAEWLSFSQEIENPYYGASMLGCGSVVNTLK